MKKIDSCIFCNTSGFEKIASFKNPFPFNIYKCLECGSHFQWPKPKKTFLKKFYSSLYKGKLGIVSAEEAFFSQDVNQEKKRIQAIEKYKKSGRLLDIGASSGFFLSEVAKNKKWNCFGIEFTKEGVEEAKNLFNLHIKQGEVFDKKFPNNYFDVITMHSVLEHIPDQHEHLEWIYKKLKKGGIFVFNVPNIDSVEHQIFKLFHKQFPGYIFEHLYYYNSKVIYLLLEKHNFKIKKITSRHYSHISLPPLRPIIGWLTFFFKLLLEYTDLGGSMRKGNVLYVYAQKI